MLIGWLGRQMLPLLDADNGGGSGGNNPNPVQADQVLAQYSGDAVRMAAKVAEILNENFEYRRKNSDLTTANKDLEKRIPADGAVVLSGDDASLWDAYKSLGVKPDTIKEKLEQGTAAATERDGLKRKDTLRTVAEIAGFKPDALSDFDQLSGGLTYVAKDETETVQGRQVAVKRVYVQAEGKDTLITDYVTQTKPHMLAALKSETAPIVPAHPGTPQRDVRRPAPGATEGQLPPLNIRI